jgi:hypothetical protein
MQAALLSEHSLYALAGDFARHCHTRDGNCVIHEKALMGLYPQVSVKRVAGVKSLGMPVQSLPDGWAMTISSPFVHL